MSLPNNVGGPNSLAMAADGTLAVGTRSGYVVQMTSALTNLTSFSVGSGPDVFVAYAADTSASGPVDLGQSTIAVTPASIVAGNSTTVVLQAKDANGNFEHSGGLNVAFTLGNGAATGSFGPVSDNNNGTYTATFTAGAVTGTNTISATIGGQPLTATPATLTMTPKLIHDILLTTPTATNSTVFEEYTPDGALTETVPVPADPYDSIYPGAATALAEDPSGNIYVLNGIFTDSLATYAAATDTWTQQTFPYWDHVAETGAVGLAVYQNYVYVNAMTIGNDPSGTDDGVVRFDLTTGTAALFQYGGGQDINTLNIGLDGATS